MVKRMRARVIGVNSAGAAGYVLALGVWVLLASVIVMLTLGGAASPEPATLGETPAETTSFSELATGVSYVVAAIMTVVSITVLVLLPYWVGKIGSGFLYWIVKRLKIAPTNQHILMAKGIAIALPLVGLWIVTVVAGELPIALAMTYIAAVAMATAALLLFLLQLMLGRLLRVPSDTVW